ncbi:MAG: peptidylprolyl isomerase [Candidatus Aminicenantes bacterium]|nr:peptidylprolyl isomerase [Candidatus Aminicenantes bacterium]OQX52776.1 MAG: peptidylprolyl isomerase [Candidatus Aminicenantes bacterium 4484_214]RLE00963.1 MAG: peptidylprolyl isomerase [Candidatus Aminicenantes bacterium]RLE04362.1 MAG: peptidylprolyl isomerase [Candidatus Aminicenantes bacterium]HHF42947.1 peptidylprolyl isomerase [Candidatus Aminicenantes bacterium]
MAQTVKNGDTVKVHYTGRFEDGVVFDSSEGRDPLEFTVGAGMLIRGFEDALIGMAPGEKKTVRVEPQDAYGDYDDNLVLTMPLDRVPEDITPEIGMELQLISQSGQKLPVVVKEVQEEAIILDANHPLAGKVLVFDIELLEIA